MKKLTFSIIFIFTVWFGYSQGQFILPENKTSDKIKFKLINNLIVIPVEINGAELTFLLDSGVRKPIIFNLLNVSDSLAINQTETIFLRGLGEGEPIEAIRSKKNVFKIGKAININQNLYAVFNENLNFTPRLGIPVHGIIGYDIFKDFIVEINYSKKFLKLHNPLTYVYKRCKSCEILDLEFNANKPYLNAYVKNNDQKKPVKLLIDSGGSDALWLFEDKTIQIEKDQKYFYDFLGHGLSGSVYGKRSKVKEVHLNSFILKNVNVAFPDSSSISYAKNFEHRNGSFSGGLLKRFNVIIDYHNSIITLKKSRFFGEPFDYNKSGIELEQTGIRLVNEKDSKFVLDNENLVNDNNVSSGNFILLETKFKLSVKPAYSVVELRKDSPADRIGIKVGDVLLYINNKPAYNYSLQEITRFFYGETSSRLRLKVERNGLPLTFVFKLEDPMKEKNLSE